MAHYADMSLDELEKIATAKRNERDIITKELREIVSEIDKHKASSAVHDIISGLSDEQKKEMYAQLVGVNTAKSVSKGVKANG